MVHCDFYLRTLFLNGFVSLLFTLFKTQISQSGQEFQLAIHIDHYIKINHLIYSHIWLYFVSPGPAAPPTQTFRTKLDIKAVLPARYKKASPFKITFFLLWIIETETLTMYIYFTLSPYGCKIVENQYAT